MKRFRILLLLVVIGGASLRLFAIGAKGLWLDEALSWRLAQFPVSMMIERTGESTTVHPPLYFVLLRAWTASFGDSEAALRSLSAVAGILAVLAVYFLAAELASFVPRRYGPCVWRIRVCSGVLAATFLALSPLHVYLAKQARGYTLATLWFVLCSWALLRGLPVGSRGWHRSAWLLYALGALAFCYTHYLGLFSVAAQGLFVALYLWAPGWRRRLRGPASAADAEGDCSLPSAPGGSAANLPARSCRREAMLAGVLFLAAYLPWAPRLWAQSETVRTSWMRELDVNDCARQTYAALLATCGIRPEESMVASWAVVFVLVAVLVYVSVRLGWAGAYCGIAAVLPVCLLLVYSALSMRSIFDVRYLVFAQLIWLIAFAMAVACIQHPLERYLTAGLLIVCCATGLWDNWTLLGSQSNPGVRGAVDYILARRRADEPVVALNAFVFFPAAYYMRETHPPPVLYVARPDRQTVAGAAQMLDADLATADAILASEPRGIWLLSTSAFGGGANHGFPLPANWKRGRRLRFRPELHSRWDSATVVQYCYRAE